MFETDKCKRCPKFQMDVNARLSEIIMTNGMLRKFSFLNVIFVCIKT